MNLELIKKYLPEFNSYVKGQPLTLGYKTHWGTYEWTDLVWADWDSSINEHIIIVNDEYLPYRKALAEGRHIQFFNTKDSLYDSSKPLHTWQDIDKIHTHGRPSDYRIKPEEPEFKVGDWITVNEPAGTFIECISGINDDTYILSGTNICYKSQATKWNPTRGEVCIVWDDDCLSSPSIIKFDYTNDSSQYRATDNTCWDNCMPFTGVVPPHMKDN